MPNTFELPSQFQPLLFQAAPDQWGLKLPRFPYSISVDYQQLFSVYTNNPSITVLDVRGAGVNNEKSKVIAGLIEESRLTGLDLSENTFSDFKAIAFALEKNTRLTHLALSHTDPLTNGLYDCFYENFTTFCSILERNVSLKFLDLSENDLGDIAIQVLAYALANNSTLTTLNVSNTSMDGLGSDGDLVVKLKTTLH
jgi:hypothetical protein